MEEKNSAELYAELSDIISKLERSAFNIGEQVSELEESMFEQQVQNKIRIIAENAIFIEGLISPLEAMSEDLFLKSITDRLTQLKNRMYFEEVIKQEVEGIVDAACIMIDVDNFGDYNNIYGCQQGDVALQTIARVIRENADAEFIARYGGEEFSIILAGYSNTNNDVVVIAESVRQGIESEVVRPFSIQIMGDEKLEEVVGEIPDMIKSRIYSFFETDSIYSGYYHELLRKNFFLKSFSEAEINKIRFDRKLFAKALGKVRKYLRGMQKVTASLGVSVRKSEESVESLIYRADRALYQAKETGKNKVCLF